MLSFIHSFIIHSFIYSFFFFLFLFFLFFLFLFFFFFFSLSLSLSLSLSYYHRYQPSGFWGTQAQQAAMQAAMQTPAGLQAALAAGVSKQTTGVAQYLANYSGAFDGFAVRITECNVFDRVGGVRGTWAHALQLAAAMVYLQQQAPKVRQVLYHSFDGCCGFASTYTPATVDGYFSGRLVPPLAANLTIEPWARTPAGTALQAAGQFLRRLQAHANVSALAFDPPPSPIGGVPSLLGQAQPASAALFVNLGNASGSLSQNEEERKEKTKKKKKENKTTEQEEEEKRTRATENRQQRERERERETERERERERERDVVEAKVKASWLFLPLSLIFMAFFSKHHHIFMLSFIVRPPAYR